MRFNEEQKRKLVKMINERILSHIDKITFFHKTIEHFHHKYILKFDDDECGINIYIYDHFRHKDIEIDVHNKSVNNTLIFDSHQYFRNPKDIRNLINSIIELYPKMEEKEENNINEILK